MIHARGVTLRLPTLGDYPAWRALREASADYLSRIEPDWQAPMDRESFAREVEQIEQAARDGSGCSLLICRPSGDLVGGVTLGPFVGGVGLLGIWIGVPFVGRGYAIRTVDVVLRIAFDVLRLDSVAASVLHDNDASMRILEFFGFEQQWDHSITLRVAGEPRLHFVYQVTRDEWNVSPSKQSRDRISWKIGERNNASNGEPGSIGGDARGG